MEKLIKNTLLGEKSQYQKTEVNVAEFYIRVSFKRNIICSNQFLILPRHPITGTATR
jgi:hypothetical protein